MAWRLSVKVGDLVEVNGSVGVLLEIKPNKVPPYQVWYRIQWQHKEGHWWHTKHKSDPPLKKL
jgi:hypothetical protein